MANKQLDLVDEMHWEDVVDFETLEEAGLEDKENPIDKCFAGSIISYMDWFYEGSMENGDY